MPAQDEPHSSAGGLYGCVAPLTVAMVRGLETLPYEAASSGPTEATRQPWQLEPRRLYSWLEMLFYSANRFVWIGSALNTIRADIHLLSMAVRQGEPILNMMAELDDTAIEKASRLLKEVESCSREIGLNISADTAGDIVRELQRTDRRRKNCQWLIDQTKTLEDLVNRELRERDFLYIPPERSKFFSRPSQPFPFGEDVAKVFPSAGFDIFESAMCMALDRPTAAVMHTMRALEPALVAMATDIGVSLKRDNWHEVIGAIEAKLNPNDIQDREKREFLSAAAVQFRYFKDAWRNIAMHAREKYTNEEAEQIYTAVKVFMNQLAKRLKE